MKDEPRVIKADRFPYFKDSEIYALWIYINPELTGRKLFTFEDLTGADTSSLLSIQFITDSFNLWGISLENPHFHKGSYVKYASSEAQERLEAYLERNKDKKSATALHNILDNKFNIADLDEVNSLTLNTLGISEFIEFGKDISPSSKKKISSLLNKYIDEFIKDNLEKIDKNFWILKRQIEHILSDFRSYQRDYGNDFIFKHDPERQKLFDDMYSGYLFIHSILAMEKLGYLKIHTAWIENDNGKSSPVYKIKLTLFKSEYQDSEKEGTKTVTKQNPELIVEGNIGYFKFYKQGQKIRVGKTTSRKYRLLECLTNPLGVAKTIDTIFDSIKKSKDASDPDLSDSYLSSNRKQEIIEYTMKELQKIDGLKGKISIETHQNGNSALLRLNA